MPPPKITHHPPDCTVVIVRKCKSINYKVLRENVENRGQHSRRQELALRYVLEDGKLNVCLRNLVEWRKFHRQMRIDRELAEQTPSVSDIYFVSDAYISTA